MNASGKRTGKAAVLRNRKKPEPVEIDEDAIPDLLKHFDRWVVWSWKWSGKREKTVRPEMLPIGKNS
jgi:hypothetical protein